MDYFQIYADFLKKHFKLQKPMRIVCDPSNGTAGKVLEKLTDVPNLEIILINDTIDADFKAHGPNPLEPGATDDAAKAVIEHKADFAAIFDADADRAFFVDDKGNTLPSFMTSLLLFKNNTPPFVADELVYKALEHTKGVDMNHIFPSKIGTRYIKELLNEKNAGAAGEYSGHFYFKDFFGSDSGIFAMLEVANTLSAIKEPLSEFRASLPPHEMLSAAIELGNKKWSDVEPKILAFAESKGGKIERREGITLDMGDMWLNMRTSNTEPVLKFIGGTSNHQKLTELIEEVKKLV
jgi:phosphomannomutase